MNIYYTIAVTVVIDIKGFDETKISSLASTTDPLRINNLEYLSWISLD